MGDLKQAASPVRLQGVTCVDKSAVFCAMGVEDEDDLGGVVLPQEIGDDIRLVRDILPNFEDLHSMLIPLHRHIYAQYLFHTLALCPT